MSLKPMLIAPFQTGLETDIDPWLAPMDSFRKLNNIHIKRGNLEKREGYRPFGYLIPMGATVNISDITQSNPGVVTTAGAHGYSTGDKVFIKSVGGMSSLNNKIYTITVTAINKFSINLNTTSLSAYTVGGTVALTSIITDRVMGITRYVESDGAQTTLAFNARRAYRYNTFTDAFVQLDAGDIFSSGEYDYIWAANWQSGGGTNRLYFTNGIAGTPAALPTSDGIRYYDGTTDTNNTVQFYPTLYAGPPKRTLVGAKLIFSLGQRLIVLNTNEFDESATNNYPQRARWCAKQDPSNWNDVIAGGGGYTDAATGDQIVSARALQNQIIVFFTNSVWTLIPTSDPNRAFKWKKLNNFRACDGRMASIGYDKYVVSFGIRGITATDGVETRRVDNKISDFTINDINVSQFEKVFCEKSYANKRTWTLYNTIETTDDENDSALILDEDSSAFNTYSINLNCLGYGNFSKDFGLDDFTVENDLDLALDDFNDEDFFSYFWQDGQETFLGGDLNGGIYILETDGDDNGSSITSTFSTNAWSPFKEEGIESQLNYVDFYIDTHLKTKAIIDFYKDTATSPYLTKTIDFLPNLDFVCKITGATITDPVNVSAPSHGLSTGDIIYIYGVEGMNSLNSGEEQDAHTITVVDENSFTIDDLDGTSFDTYSSGGSIYKRKFYKTKTWKRVYGGGIGFQHRIKLTSEGQDKPFRILGLKPYFKPIGKRDNN
ncbi:MAG: ubiquitin-activating E1 FCCH domain-containing protein [Kosmotogaceae bacterium]